MNNTQPFAAGSNDSPSRLETIVFGVIAILLALATVVLATVQIYQARSARTRSPDVESHSRDRTSSDGIYQLSTFRNSTIEVSVSRTPEYVPVSSASKIDH